MRVGYGRGYYGDGQLAPKTPRRGGWGKLALVVGVGAVIWLVWPRRPKLDYAVGPEGNEPKPALPPSTIPMVLPDQSAPAPQQLFVQPPPALQPSPQISQIAEARGYPSQQAYEDAVVASARQLQASGAKVMLAPHLAHLAPRLGS